MSNLRNYFVHVSLFTGTGPPILPILFMDRTVNVSVSCSGNHPFYA